MSSASLAGRATTWQASAPLQEATALRDAVQRLALGNRRYGYHLQAWHWKADGVVVAAAGTWDVELARSGDGWRISRQKLAVVGAGSLSPPSR